MRILYRPFISSFFFLFCVHPLSSQTSNPFAYQFLYTGDLLYNALGGIKSGTNYLGIANINIAFDTQKAKMWQGGTFFVNLANMHGSEPSKNLIGDFQGITNIEAGNHTMLYELWYYQKISTYSITVGLQDMNVAFMSNDIAGSFINSSFALHPTLSHNIPAPIYPLTALGVMLNWNVTPSVDWKIALYDGTPESFTQNSYNLKWVLNKKNGWLFIIELDKTENLLQGLSGSYKVGFYFRQSETSKLSIQNNYGIYSIVNQQLIKSKAYCISFFSQIGIAPMSLNINPYFLSIGLIGQGLIHNRPNDEISIGLANAVLRCTNVKNETALEIYYVVHLNKTFYIKPDIQYIIHPASQNRPLNNDLAAIVRFGIHL
jgi:porin